MLQIAFKSNFVRLDPFLLKRCYHKSPIVYRRSDTKRKIERRIRYNEKARKHKLHLETMGIIGPSDKSHLLKKIASELIHPSPEYVADQKVEEALPAAVSPVKKKGKEKKSKTDSNYNYKFSSGKYDPNNESVVAENTDEYEKEYFNFNKEEMKYYKKLVEFRKNQIIKYDPKWAKSTEGDEDEKHAYLNLDELSVFDWPLPTGKEHLNSEDLKLLHEAYRILSEDRRKFIYLPSTLLYCLIPVMSKFDKRILLLPQSIRPKANPIKSMWENNRDWIVPIAEKLMDKQPNLAQFMKAVWNRTPLEARIRFFYNSLNIDMLRSDPEFEPLFKYWDRIFGEGTYPERIEYELRRFIYKRRERLAKAWVELDNILCKTLNEIKIVNAMTIEPIYIQQNLKFRENIHGFDTSTILVENYRIPLSYNPEDSTLFQMIVDDVNDVELASVCRQLLLPFELTLTHEERIQDRRMELIKKIRSRGFERDPKNVLHGDPKDKTVLLGANNEFVKVHPQLLDYLEDKQDLTKIQKENESKINEMIDFYLTKWRDLNDKKSSIVKNINSCVDLVNKMGSTTSGVPQDDVATLNTNTQSESNGELNTDFLSHENAVRFASRIPNVDLKKIIEDVEKRIGGPIGSKGETNLDQEIRVLPYQDALAQASRNEEDSSECSKPSEVNEFSEYILSDDKSREPDLIEKSGELGYLRTDNEYVFYLVLYKFIMLLSNGTPEIQSHLSHIEDSIVDYFQKENELITFFKNLEDEEALQLSDGKSFEQYLEELDSSNSQTQTSLSSDENAQKSEFSEKPLFFTDKEVKKKADYSQFWEPDIPDHLLLDEEKKIDEFLVAKHNLQDMFMATDHIDPVKQEELRLFTNERMRGIEAVPPEGFFDTDNQGRLNIIPGTEKYDSFGNSGEGLDGDSQKYTESDQGSDFTKGRTGQTVYKKVQNNLQTNFLEPSPGIAPSGQGMGFFDTTANQHALQQQLDVYENTVLPDLLEDRQKAMAKKLTEDAPHLYDILKTSADEAGELMDSLSDNEELHEQITHFNFRAKDVALEGIGEEFSNTIAGPHKFKISKKSIDFGDFGDLEKPPTDEDEDEEPEIIGPRDLLDDFGPDIVKDDLPVGKYWIQKEIASDMAKGYVRGDDEFTPYYSDSSALVEQAAREIEKISPDDSENSNINFFKNLERLDLLEGLEKDEPIMTIVERSLRNLRMSKDLVYNQATALMETEEKLSEIFEDAKRQTEIDLNNPELMNTDAIKKLEETYGKPVKLFLNQPLSPEDYLTDVKATIYSRKNTMKSVKSPEELELDALRRTALQHIGPYLNKEFFVKSKDEHVTEEHIQYDEIESPVLDNRPLYVKNCFDPDEIYSEEHLDQYVVFSDEDLKKFFCEGLGGKLVKREFLGTNINAIMIRRHTIDAINYLRKCKNAAFPFEHKEYLPVIFYGYNGTGKSSALTLTVHWARSSDWFVVYIPDAWTWMNTGSYLDYSKKREKWDQPRLAREFFDKLINAHHEKLRNIRLKSSLSSSWNLKGNDLLSLVEFGFTFQEYAGDVFAAVTREIELITEYPVLLAIDNYNYLYNKSINFADPNSKSYVKAPIRADQLSMASWLYKSHKKNLLANGIVAVALSGGSPIDNFFKECGDDSWRYINVPPYSINEMNRVLQHYYETKWIHSQICHGSTSQKYLYQLTSGFPAEIWNYTKRL